MKRYVKASMNFDSMKEAIWKKIKTDAYYYGLEHNQNLRFWQTPENKKSEQYQLEWKESILNWCKNFVSAMELDEWTPLSDGIRAQDLADAIYESLLEDSEYDLETWEQDSSYED